MEILYTFIAVFLVSLTAFVGILTLSLKEDRLNKIIPYFIALASGTMLGGFFIHILPELVEKSINDKINFSKISLLLLIGILTFYIIERLFHMHHHAVEIKECEHWKSKKIKPVGYMILFSDAIHNFLDGVTVATAFSFNISLGLITTFLVVLHEIPHEIGNFAVLINSGFEKTKALWFNFLSALTSMLGAALTLIAINYIQNIQIYLMTIAGGSFIYIALVDLMPELHNHKHKNKKTLSIEFLFILLGIALMVGVKFLSIYFNNN